MLKDKEIILQSVSIYTCGDERSWNKENMFTIMYDIASTSLKCLSKDIEANSVSEKEGK